MKCSIEFSAEAEKFLKKLDNSVKKRLVNKIEELSNNPRLGKPLISNFVGFWSLRVGKYRVIYQIDQGRFVVDIEHRKNIY